MRIAFDATTLRPRQTGIGYYTEHLLRHLLCEAGTDEIVLLSNRRIKTSKPFARPARVYERRRFPLRIVWMHSFATLVLRDVKPQVAHFTNSISPPFPIVPTVVTIHDMSLVLYPEFHPWRRGWTRPLVIRSARRAAAVIAVSQSAKRDVVRLTGIPSEKVKVVYEAAAPEFRPIKEAQVKENIRRKYDLAERIVLYLGTIEPRKNLTGLIRAYSEVLRKDNIPHQLVCVGALGWGYQQVLALIDSSSQGNKIRLLGYVPYADLPAIYNVAEMFVFPSFHEGFGLPVIEAMACGLPVIASGNSSIAEVAGDAGEIIDASETSSIENALRKLIHSPDRRRELAQRGLNRAREFSWRRAARETLEVYQSVTAMGNC